MRELTCDEKGVKRRCILLTGFSLGAKWAMKIAQDSASYMDAVACFGGYPSNKDPWVGCDEARKLMQVQIPILSLLPANDEFTDAVRFPSWFAQLTAAHNAPPGDQPGQRRETCLVRAIPGNHATAHDLFLNMKIERIEEPAIQSHWASIVGLLRSTASLP